MKIIGLMAAYFAFLLLIAVSCFAQTTVQTTEAPVQSGVIWIFQHTPTNAGLACTWTMPGVAPKKMQPGKDYIWWGNSSISPMAVTSFGEWIQGPNWPPGTVTCIYSYVVKAVTP